MVAAYLESILLYEREHSSDVYTLMKAFNTIKLTYNIWDKLNLSEKIAYDYGNQELAQEHLLYALITQDDSLILKLLEKMSIQGSLFINRVEELLNKRPKYRRAGVCRSGSEQCTDPCRG